MEIKKINKFVSTLVVLALVLISFSGLSFAGDLPLQTTSKGEVAASCGGFNAGGVKDSLIMSIATMCVPGILSKTYEWKQFKCERVVCTYDAIKNGLDPAFCNSQYSYKTCNYITGEAFALPGLNFVKQIRQKIADALANPVGIVLGAGTKILRTYVKSGCKTANTCTLGTNPIYYTASVSLVIIDTASLLQTIKDIRANGFIPKKKLNDPYVNACDRLPAIKKEMDLIIKFG